MKEDLLKKLLESILGRSKTARGARGEDSSVFYCPSCKHHKKKLTFNLITQQFQCWVCDFKGHRAFQFLKKAGAPGAAFGALKDAFNHAETFMSYGKKVYLIEMGDKDPSELGFKTFTKLLHNAVELTTSVLMKKRLALS